MDVDVEKLEAADKSLDQFINKRSKAKKRANDEEEQRLRRAILEGRDYPGKDADIALVQRKHRELSPEQLRRAVWGEG